MAEVVKTESGRGVCANRVELIHMITNLIENSNVTLIEDRDDASMLALHIVDGLEDEADRIEMRKIGISPDKTLIEETGLDGLRARAAINENNALRKPSPRPLSTCPDMAYPDLCAVCLWYDRDKRVCAPG